MTEANRGQEGLRRTTRVLTHGFDPRLSVGSARPAVFRSSTYVFSSPESAERAFAVATGRAEAQTGEGIELIYSRLNHPNAEILEDQVVPLERGATDAVVFNSGMAAIMTVLLTFLRPGASVVYTVPAYGGTQHFIADHLTTWGITGVPIPAGDGKRLTTAIRSSPNLGIVLIETPANPTLTMTDIEGVAEIASESGPARPLVVVDNTLLGPAFQHPLLLKADLVVYSATKYLSGNSDMLAGLVIGKDPHLTHQIRLLRSLFGNILQPDECWMLDSRLPTVSLRMNRASKNAQRIAERLANHPKVARMHYPSLIENSEQKRIFLAQCEFPGAMLSFEVRGGKPAAFDFLRNLRIARNAVSLGGVETLACHPKTTTHSGFSQEESECSGVTDGLIRVSVGIEHWRDLLEDFERALDKVQ
jgi:methionine-gamma-lyase